MAHKISANQNELEFIGNFSMARWAIPVLVLLSGFCGISYEILYTRLLGNLLGNQFTINATVLLTFLLGIGFGTLYAHRFLKWLWAIEAGIGLYALFMALGYSQIDRFIYESLPFLGVSILACAAICFVLLLVPAFLVGCSLPLFAAYLNAVEAKSVFSLTYAIYNVGAAITAIAMEFYLIREFGIQSTMLLLALLNLAVATTLFSVTRFINFSEDTQEDFYLFPRRILVGLALASVASAIFQLLMMKVAEFIFGPFNETFSLVLATVLIGLAIGSTVCNRMHLSFSNALLIAMVGLTWLLAIHPTAVAWYATWYQTAVETYFLHVLLKFILVFVLMGLPSIGFGATIPALLNSYRNVARESGQLLFWSATANAFGFCLMAFVLHRLLDYGVMLVLLVSMVFLSIGINKRFQGTATWLAGALVAIALINYSLAWNEMLLYIGHKNLHTLEDLQDELDERFYADRFKGPQDVFAITWRGGEPFFFINGYISVPLSSPTEKHVGALSSMLAPRADKALVLGMGTGASASTVGLSFDSTDVVEINNVVLNNLYRMAEYNLDIEQNPRVNIIHDDGIHYLKTANENYSLILNTVTSPLYFSSSKLYTLDFLLNVKQRLTPDGVYITWIDWHIGDRGLDIILQTLSKVFNECWLTYMSKNYFLLGCSNSPIGVRQRDRVANEPTLKAHFAEEFDLPLRLLPYSIVETNLLDFIGDTAAPVNSLDHPVLEFEMARLKEYTSLREFKQRLRKKQDLRRVADRLSETIDWDVGEFVYFADMRLSSQSSLYRIISENSRDQLEFSFDQYAHAALTIADDLGTAEAFYDHGEQLFRRKRFNEAIKALEKAVALDSGHEDAWYVLGKSYLALELYPSALDAFMTTWNTEKELYVVRRLIQTLIEMDRFEQALDWLAKARLINDADEDPALAYYNGLAELNLGRKHRASEYFQLALIYDSDYKDARKALRQINTGIELSQQTQP